MTIAIEIAMQSEGWSAIAGLEALVRRSVEASAAATSPSGANDAELSVLFCDDAAIRALNRGWRGKDKATNVLSFPADAPPGGPRLLGDIAIAFETTAREAAAEGKPFDAHVAHLVVHGFLHLVGFDHEDAAEAAAMERLEQRILARLGYADPYADADLIEIAAP